ncbi:MAG: LamG-like jellyroll fold domain-containing protein, partial [Bdellovibrionota bacterium]|nr:LamG-like jellyroll fold domain-containing protein [Bdellovibrionota bacterium]
NILLQFIFLITSSACLLDEIVEQADLNFCPGQRVDDGSCSDEYDNLGKIDFSDSTEIDYDEEFVEIKSSGTYLRSSGLIGDSTSFPDGNYHGSTLDSSTKYLRPFSSNDDFVDAKKILPNYKDNIIAYYRFEGDGTDSSGKANHLSFTNGETTSSAHSLLTGQHLLLDGVDDMPKKTTPNGFDNITEISACLWVKHLNYENNDDYLFSYYSYPGASKGRVQLFRDYNGAAFGRSNTYTIFIRDQYGNNNRIEANDSVANANIWNHVCFSFKAESSSGLRMFINGKESEFSPRDTSAIKDFSTSTPLLQIGAFNNNSIGNEAIDELVIWNKEIPADQLKQIYFQQAGQFGSFNQKEIQEEDSLVAYYPLDSNWLDHSSNTNHAQPHNNNFTDDSLPIFSSFSHSGTGAAKFDDTQLQYAQIPNSSDLDNLEQSSFTLSAWYYPIAEPKNDYNLNKRHGIITKMGFHMGLLYNENKQFRFDLWSPSGSYIGFTGDGYFTPNKYYHVVGVLDYENKQARLYVDSVLIGSRDYASMDVRTYGSAKFYIGSASYGTSTSGAGWPANGYIDDVSIWKKALAYSKVNQLYERGKQKHYSSYESPVYKVGENTSIEGLKVQTPLAFFKSLSLQAETAYESFSSHLAKDLVAYYDFEVDSYNGSTDEVKDRVNTYHGVYKGGPKKMQKGVIGHSLGFNSFNISSDKNLVIENTFSIAFWIKAQDTLPSNWDQIFRKGDPSDKLSFLKLQLIKGNRRIALRMDVNGSSSQTLVSNVDVVDGTWHHINYTFDATTLKLYIDGKLNRQMPISVVGNIDSPTHAVWIGNSAAGVQIDEFGIWKRALNADEANELYRRTANRIKYLVRTCDQADCSDQNWTGIKNIEGLAFSEMQNASNLKTPEYVPQSLANRGPLDLSFSTLKTYLTKRKYFQYKVLFESEENSACNSSQCLPELKSIEFVKDSSYFKSSYAVVNKTGISYKSLFSIKIKERENCNLKFQISNDGQNFYYFDS